MYLVWGLMSVPCILFGVYCLYYVSCLGFNVCTMYLVWGLLSVLCMLFGVYCLYYVSVFVLFRCLCCIVFVLFDTGLLDVDAGRLARNQNPEGPATGHPDTGFLGFLGS
jgi:hypothetical protein